MAGAPVQIKTTRRRFLDALTGAVALGWLASIFYPVFRYLTPLPHSGPKGPARLTRDEVSALERDGFVIVPAAGKRVLVFANGDGELRALDARCTHEGCTVRYDSNDAVVLCACHNALFDVDGRVLSGPPPKPLPNYLITRDDDGEIVVDTSPA